MDISIYMCLYLHIYYLNRVAPPFEARPNLGSRPSCQPWASFSSTPRQTSAESVNTKNGIRISAGTLGLIVTNQTTKQGFKEKKEGKRATLRLRLFSSRREYFG